MCPHTQETQGIDHTTAAAKTPRVATRVLDPENQNLLSRNIITKEHPREERKHYTFTPRIRYFNFPKTWIPSHIKTYDGSEDPEDHLKIFQTTAKTERWEMPTWCHMFNSTLTGNAKVWFDDLP
ncbi:hypothetical protein Tco_1135500 [Tanacetum coccineum]